MRHTNPKVLWLLFHYVRRKEVIHRNVKRMEFLHTAGSATIETGDSKQFYTVPPEFANSACVGFYARVFEYGTFDPFESDIYCRLFVQRANGDEILIASGSIVYPDSMLSSQEIDGSCLLGANDLLFCTADVNNVIANGLTMVGLFQ